MNYKEKLKRFNGTKKYQSELDFLRLLVRPQRGQKILDYGCGLGTAMRDLTFPSGAEIYGYDITDEYYEGDAFFFRREMYFQVDTIYFMHSIAHISNPPLEKVRSEFLKKGGRLVIITPNADWLDKGYNSDPTVVKHYTLDKLLSLVTDHSFIVEHFGQFGEFKKGKGNERLFLVAKLG